MAYRKKCPHCQEFFVTTRKQAKFCSNKCANAVLGSERTVKSDEDVKAYLLQRCSYPNGKEGCWQWIGSLNDQGYAMAFVRQGTFRASRLSYELFVAPIPDGMDILHDPVKCNNPACINPSHLRCGTHYENMMDRVVSETLQKGENHYFTHLKDDDIREIRRLYTEEHVKQDEIGAYYGVDFVTIHDIIKAKTWKHVDPDTYVPPGDGRQKLTEEDARLIIKLYRDGLTAKAIAARLGGLVTKANVQNITAGRSKIWRHLLD